MIEKRNRTQSLTIRLTDKEKSSIVRRAENAKLSVTDYILSCTLCGNSGGKSDIRELMKQLAALEKALQLPDDRNATPEYFDVLESLSEVRTELSRLARVA